MQEGERAPDPGSAPTRTDGAKDRDYWWTVFATDPIALPLTRFLTKHRWLSPDATSYIALALGVGVGPVFIIGTTWALVVGVILFYVAFVFDCIDGKLARALGVTSARGQALDHLADGGRRASATLGLAIHIWRSESFANDDIWFVIGYAVLAYYFLEISGAERGAPSTGMGGRMSRALARRRLLPNPGMPDVQAVVFIIGPITSLVLPALIVGIAMVVVAILLTLWRRLR